MNRLMITADNFGLCLTANETIERLFNLGAITGTSLIPIAEYTDHAIAIASRNRQIKVGLQWALHALTTAQKWKPLCSLVPSICDENGYLYTDARVFAAHAAAEDVLLELQAQYAAVVSNGITPTHAISKQGMIYTGSHRNFLLEYFMVSSGNHLPFRYPQNIEHLSDCMSVELIEYIEAFSMNHQSAIESAWLFNVKMPERVISRIGTTMESYKQLKHFYLTLLETPLAAVTEVVLDPMFVSEEGKQTCKDWQQRSWEARLLTDPDFLSVCEAYTVCSYDKAFSPSLPEAELQTW